MSEDNGQKNKNTGMGGRKAFFKKPNSDTGQAVVAETNNDAARAKKIRTTVTMYAETLSGLNLLKANLTRKRSKNVTLSDVLEEAIQDLMRKEGIHF
jgi:uncharacterized protein YllA (UPF0747 family)